MTQYPVRVDPSVEVLPAVWMAKEQWSVNLSNARDYDEFFEHYGYIIAVPGRWLTTAPAAVATAAVHGMGRAALAPAAADAPHRLPLVTVSSGSSQAARVRHNIARYHI